MRSCDICQYLIRQCTISPKFTLFDSWRPVVGYRDLKITAAYILELVEIDCGFKIWHIKPTPSPHIFKGTIF